MNQLRIASAGLAMLSLFAMAGCQKEPTPEEIESALIAEAENATLNPEYVFSVDDLTDEVAKKNYSEAATWVDVGESFPLYSIEHIDKTVLTAKVEKLEFTQDFSGLEDNFYDIPSSAKLEGDKLSSEQVIALVTYTVENTSDKTATFYGNDLQFAALNSPNPYTWGSGQVFYWNQVEHPHADNKSYFARSLAPRETITVVQGYLAEADVEQCKTLVLETPYMSDETGNVSPFYVIRIPQ